MKNIFIHLGFVLILAGLSIICVDKVSASINEYCDDVSKSGEIVEAVNKDYDAFKEQSVGVKESIVEVSKSFDFFLDDFPNENVEILNKVHAVEEKINNLSVITNDLLDKCEYKLNNSKMNNQCESFMINLNNMMESYNKMISVYNEVINKYNEYTLSNGREQVEEYKENVDDSIKMALSKNK